MLVAVLRYRNEPGHEPTGVSGVASERPKRASQQVRLLEYPDLEQAGRSRRGVSSVETPVEALRAVHCSRVSAAGAGPPPDQLSSTGSRPSTRPAVRPSVTEATAAVAAQARAIGRAAAGSVSAEGFALRSNAGPIQRR